MFKQFLFFFTLFYLSYGLFNIKERPKLKPKPKPIEKSSNSSLNNQHNNHQFEGYCSELQYNSGEICGNYGLSDYSFCANDIEGNYVCIASAWCDVMTICSSNLDCPVDYVCVATCGQNGTCNPLCGNSNLPFAPTFDDAPYYSPDEPNRCYDKSDLNTIDLDYVLREGTSFGSYMENIKSSSSSSSSPSSSLLSSHLLLPVIVINILLISSFVIIIFGGIYSIHKYIYNNSNTQTSILPISSSLTSSLSLGKISLRTTQEFHELATFESIHNSKQPNEVEFEPFTNIRAQKMTL